MHKNFAVVICSRVLSSRLPEKAFRVFNKSNTLTHLTKRLHAAELPVIVAVPEKEAEKFRDEGGCWEYAKLFASPWATDPLRRLVHTANHYELKFVIRITHDKIFVDTEELLIAIKQFISERGDYLYSSELTDGTGFEIISTELLQRAATKYKNVEHVSFPVKFMAKNPIIYKPKYKKTEFRLLLDYPKDAQLFDVIFNTLGDDCNLNEATRFLYKNPPVALVNWLPEVTVYTCAYNAEKTIAACMKSVQEQDTSFPFEYIIVDDASTDETLRHICWGHDKWYRNPKNIGLAASSNVALSHSKGKYIIRLDADDYFSSNKSLQLIYDEIIRTRADVVYPANYYGSLEKIQHAHEEHHVGGAIFNKRSLEFLRFRDDLRNLEGLDLFMRAKESLDIAYLDRPIFFYSQNQTSMSKTNLAEREATRARILGNLQ